MFSSGTFNILRKRILQLIRLLLAQGIIPVTSKHHIKRLTRFRLGLNIKSYILEFISASFLVKLNPNFGFGIEKTNHLLHYCLNVPKERAAIYNMYANIINEIEKANIKFLLYTSPSLNEETSTPVPTASTGFTLTSEIFDGSLP